MKVRNGKVMLPSLKRFRSNDSGAVTVEFVLWVPLLAGFLLLIADVSAAFTTQAAMWRSASDVARGIATGRVHADDAQSLTPFVLDSRPTFGADGFVTIQLSRDFSEVGSGFILPVLGTLRVELRHLVEPSVSDQG